jgi:ribose transport system substrate-binding protein
MNLLVARHVNAIALAPIDQKALVPAVNNAAANHIPVAIFDSSLESTEYVTYVATDNAGAGRLAARRMGKILNGFGKVAIISFMPGSAATIEREQAFRDELRLLFPGISVVAMQYGMADQSRAEHATEEILQTHPELSGIFADNESSSTGAARALRRNGSRARLVAFDSSEELVSGLKAGHIDSLVVQNPYRMGYQTIRGIAAKLAGKTPPLFVDSGSRLVLADDLDAPEVHDLLFPTLSAQTISHTP